MALLDDLKSFFNLKSVKTNSFVNSNEKVIAPNSAPILDTLKKEKDTMQGFRNSKKNMKSYIQELWDTWNKDTYDSPATLKNRLDRYSDLEYMYFNDTIISMAVDLYADETIQYDSQTKPIIVNAPKKATIKYINSFFETIGLDQSTLRAIAFDLALYGDSFAINGISSEGIESFQGLDVRDITERIEFSASKVNTEKYRENKSYMKAITSKYEKLKQLDLSMRETTNISEFFKNYLFGFSINENIVLPPWAVTHFRILNNSSEFYPYGRPLLINSISTFRKLIAGKNLM